MDKQQSYQLVSDRLMNLIKENFGAYFKTYYIGAPEQIPESALPACIVQTVRGAGEVDATMTDITTEETVINLVANSKDGFAASDDDDTVMRQLQVLVQQIDPATNTYSTSSILGVIRSNLTLDSTIINSDVKWDYGQNPRVNETGDPISSLCEAVVSVTTTQRVLIPNRT